MSDQSNAQQQEENQALEFFIDKNDKLVFPTLANSILTTSDELCRMAKMIFQNFEDYYGTVAVINNGVLTLSVHFAQIENRNDGAYYAFEPNGSLNGANKESGLRRIKQFDRTVTEGNKFSITENGKSAMGKFMSRQAKDQNGNVKWNALGVITQYSDAQLFGGTPILCNVINLVDPIAVLKELYGEEARLLTSIDEDGNAVLEETPVDYEILVLSSLQVPGINGALNTPSNEGPFKIDIRQINKKQLKKSAQQVGMNLTMGRNIIK